MKNLDGWNDKDSGMFTVLKYLSLCAEDADYVECEGIADNNSVDPETGELLEDDAPLESIAEGELRISPQVFMLP